jgi:hypothetical protein
MERGSPQVTGFGRLLEPKGSGRASLENGELLAQDQDLSLLAGVGSERSGTIHARILVKVR